MPKLNLRPQSLDLFLYAGDGATLQIVAKNNLGAALDLSGVVKAQIRAARIDDEALADFAVNDAAAATGSVTISLTGIQTQALLDGADKFAGFWDVEWTKAAGQPVTLVQGAVEVTADVTR